VLTGDMTHSFVNNHWFVFEMKKNRIFIESFARAIPGPTMRQNTKMCPAGSVPLKWVLRRTLGVHFLCFFQNQKLKVSDFGLISLSGDTFDFMQKYLNRQYGRYL